jgi:radical SAM protein with 4Fe4S-binding SPASM domain
MYKKLIDMNVPHLTIDIDGFSKETYEKIRVGGNFEEILKTADVVRNYIHDVGSSTRFDLIFQIVPGINEHEVETFVEWCEENNHEYKLITLHGWAGLRPEYIKDTEIIRSSPCRAQWDGLMVYWNGDVGTCFQDANGYEIFGNITHQSIKEIWQNALRKRRREHVHGILKGLCQDCKSFIGPGMPCFKSVVYPSILRSEIKFS